MPTKIRTIESIMEGAQSWTLFEDILTQLREERNKLSYDPDQLRRDKEWSELATKPVGYY